MITAFDLHGVLTVSPEIYKIVTAVCRLFGNEAWIISGPPEQRVKNELTKLGFEEKFHYDKIISVVDYLISCNHEYTIDENGNYWFDEKLWWKSKAEICKKYNIEAIFDNEERYGRYFKSHMTDFYLIKHFSNKELAMFKLVQNIMPG